MTTSALNVLDYGAVCDGRRIKGVKAAAGSTAVVVAGASFTLADVGKTCLVYKDFEAGTIRTIAAVESPTEVTLSGNAGITVSATTGCYFLYGSDNSAAFTAAFAAAQTTDVDNSVGYNQPHGLGQGLVVAPAPGSGLYCLSSEVKVPSGVMLDCAAMIANLQTDRFNPILQFEPYSSVRRLYVECLFGAGVQLGEAAGVQADIHFDTIVLWQVGETREVGGAERIPTGLTLAGSGFLGDLVWMKGAERGVYMNSGSDCSINRMHLIGCKEAILMREANQLHVGEVLLDSVGVVGGGFNAINIDHASADINLNVQAFEVSTVKPARTCDAVVAVGAITTSGGSAMCKYIRLRIMAQRTGGAVLNLQHAQDVTAELLASNTSSVAGSGEEITTGVIFGPEVQGSCDIKLAANTSITPYKGTITGVLVYQRSGTQYRASGGSAPTLAALAANGTAPPTPTANEANGARGEVLFGSGAAPSAGEQVSVTFADTTAYLQTPNVQLTPRNLASAELLAYAVGVSTTGFKLAAAKAPATSQAAGTYKFDYAIFG